MNVNQELGKLEQLKREVSQLNERFPAIRLTVSPDPSLLDHEIQLDETRHIQVALDLITFTPVRILPNGNFVFGNDCQSLIAAIDSMPDETWAEAKNAGNDIRP